MSNTPARPRALLLNPRVWAACFAFWFLVLSLVYGLGAAQVIVDGKVAPLWSWPCIRQILKGFGPLVVGTLVLLPLASWLAASRGAAFWFKYTAVVVGCSLCHAVVDGIFTGQFDFVFMAALVFGFHYAAIAGVALIIHQRRQDEERRRELQAAQLRALRAQLQPHFLFNTLHAIGVTCKQDGAIAARMTTLLGDLLRQSLRERDGGVVSLAEENELLQPYLQLQQLRFADRLRVDVDLPPEVLAAAVPDLLLQPLVENALQHGIEQRPGSGRVRVVGRRVGDRLLIDVHDDGAGVAAKGAEPPLGTGLGATRARLAALYGDRASLSLRANDQGGTTASIILPWREVAHAA